MRARALGAEAQDVIPDPVLPDGTVVRLARGVRALSRGTVLVGGAPTRVLRLTPTAAAQLVDRTLSVDTGTRQLATHLVVRGFASPLPHTLPPVSLDDLSVVIPAYGRSRALDRLLKSVGVALPGADVVVVDDATTPLAERQRVHDVVKSHGARFVASERNAGPAHARNLGSAATTTPLVLFVDTDVVLTPSAIQLLARHLATDAGLAAIAPRVAGLPVARPTRVQRYENARSSLDLGGRGGLVRPHTEIGWVSSSCLLVRVDAARGGFDGTLRAAEDVDLVWRLVQRGWRVRYEPEATVGHEHRSTLVAMLRRKMLYGSGAAPLATRHGALAAPVIVSPWGAAFLLVLLLGRRPTTVARGIVAVSTAAAATLAWRLRSMPSRGELVTRLVAASAATWTVQGWSLLIRHAWPATLALACLSSRVRRAMLISAALDSLVEYVRLRPKMSLPSFTVIRRLDDAAYGLGVWIGAFRERSPRSLLPRISRGRR